MVNAKKCAGLLALMVVVFMFYVVLPKPQQATIAVQPEIEQTSIPTELQGSAQPSPAPTLAVPLAPAEAPPHSRATGSPPHAPDDKGITLMANAETSSPLEGTEPSGSRSRGALGAGHPCSQRRTDEVGREGGGTSGILEVRCTEDFSFGRIPTWVGPDTTDTARRSGDKFRDQLRGGSGVIDPTTNLPDECFPTDAKTILQGSSEGKKDVLAKCLNRHIRKDTRPPRELLRALLQRLERLKVHWMRSRRRNDATSTEPFGGCDRRQIRKSTGYHGVTLWIQPSPDGRSSLTPERPVPSGSCLALDSMPGYGYHNSHDVERVVASSRFQQLWEAWKRNDTDNLQILLTERGYQFPLGTPRPHRKSKRWADAEGFPLVLQFADYAEEEDQCVLSMYSALGERGESFSVIDSFFGYTGKFATKSEHNKQRQYVEPVFGSQWNKTTLLSPLLSSGDPKVFSSADGGNTTEASTTKLTWDDVDKAGNRAIDDMVASGWENLEIKFKGGWSQRKKKLFFRAGPTNILRRTVASYTGDVTGHSDISVAKANAQKKNKFMDVSTYKGAMAVRGNNAALRDRMLPFTGTPMFRLINLVGEPMQIYHDFLHPYVHYVPLSFLNDPAVFEKAPKKRRKAILHEGLHHIFGSDSGDSLLGPIFNSADAALEQIANNNMRLSVATNSEEFRDEVFFQVLWMYLQVLDTVPDGPDAAPVQLEDALGSILKEKRLKPWNPNGKTFYP